MQIKESQLHRLNLVKRMLVGVESAIINATTNGERKALYNRLVEIKLELSATLEDIENNERD